MATLIVVIAWLFSIYGWSIAHRAFEEAGTPVHLGPGVSPMVSLWAEKRRLIVIVDLDGSDCHALHAGVSIATSVLKRLD